MKRVLLAIALIVMTSAAEAKWIFEEVDLRFALASQAENDNREALLYTCEYLTKDCMLRIMSAHRCKVGSKATKTLDLIENDTTIKLEITTLCVHENMKTISVPHQGIDASELMQVLANHDKVILQGSVYNMKGLSWKLRKAEKLRRKHQ